MKTLQEFDKKFSQIKNRGYIKSNRKGDTGVGKTLEDLFEIVENNSKKSDLKIGELKAFRMCTSSLLTLLTCDYRAWLIRPRQVIEKYGYLSEETNLLCLRTSVGSNPNNRGFYFTFNDEFLQVNHTDGAEILKWKWDLLNARFYKKLKSLIYVGAKTKIENECEYFHYTDYYTFQTENKQAIYNYFKESNSIYVDIRCSLKYNKKGNVYLKNHGTGFRVPPKKLFDIFKDV
jgi:hypothetical protein